MVIPFGVGIGDVLQVAKLAKTVVSELKKTGDAAPEYQILVNDLENLERVLAQINKLEPAEHDLTQLDSIRASIKACQMPLQNFLDKISKFEESLGVRTSKSRTLNGIGRRLQWKAAYRSDMNELRATLAGHVNVLTLHIALQSLKSILAAETDRADDNQDVRNEIETQRTILESLSRGQLENLNDRLKLENALKVLTDKLDQAMTLDVGMQMGLGDQAKILQSIESKSETIHIDQGEMLRKIQSELAPIKQYCASSATPDAESKPRCDQGEMLRKIQSELAPIKQYCASSATPDAESKPKGTVSEDRPSSNLAFSLKVLTIFLSGSTAALAYRSATSATTVFHSPVGHSLGHSMPIGDAKLFKRQPSNTHVEQSAKYGLDASSPDLQRDQKREVPYSRHRIVTDYASTAFQTEGGALPDGIRCSKSITGGRDRARSANMTNVTSGEAPDCSIPGHLSFIVKIEPLSPDNGVDGQPPRRTKEGYFLPPDRRNGYKHGDGPTLLLRWVGGRLSQVLRDDLIRRVNLLAYRKATIFTQSEDTPHVLAVPFDARDQHVRDTGNGWRPLTFNHQRVYGTNEYYSYTSCLGSETCIAATGSPHWMPQLLPYLYQYRPRPQFTDRIQAGLIGNLPLLFALAALSAPPIALDVLPISIQPNAWQPHANAYPTGHIPKRGVVVSVYYDPLNPDHSNTASLDKLQNGEYGPFYGPNRPYTETPSRVKQFQANRAAGKAYATDYLAGSTTGYPTGYPTGSTTRYSKDPTTGDRRGP